jgi:hypothetical protein
LYKTIVLSKALFGCELWCNITDTQLLSLEKIHRQCIKYMQSMPKSTRTDIAWSCIGLYPIKYEIDKRKLLFFGQLCYLDNRKNQLKFFLFTGSQMLCQNQENLEVSYRTYIAYFVNMIWWTTFKVICKTRCFQSYHVGKI